MPVVFPPSGFGRKYEFTAKAGIGATAGGTAHTMGSWVTLIDPLAYPIFGISIAVTGVAASAADTRGLMDIGVAPTGGGSEQVVIPFIDVGAAALVAGLAGKTYFFPLYVPAGKAIRYRWQSVTASDTTIAVLAYFHEHPPYGFAEDAPQEWTQYGADSANSRGTAVTSGNGAFGTEVQITASTSRNHRWFHVGLDWGTNTNISSGRYRVRLARDTGATDIIGVWDFLTGTTEDISGPACSFPACYNLPAGSTLYVDIDGAAAEAVSAMVWAA